MTLSDSFYCADDESRAEPCPQESSTTYNPDHVDLSNEEALGLKGWWPMRPWRARELSVTKGRPRALARAGRARRGSDERGAALVEAAFVIPLLLLLVLGGGRYG